jgi:hypothetical protein
MLVTMTCRTPGSFPDVDDALTRSEGTPSGLDVYQGRPLMTVPELVALVLLLDPAEDAVEVRAAHRALGLSHPGALLVDVYLAGRLPLRLTFHAVELAAVRLRHDFSLLDVRPHTAHSCGTPRCVTDRSTGHVTGRPSSRQAPYRLDARYSTRAQGARWRTMQEKDETSRDIGIASLPLRAFRPSGGFVLGTL